MLKQDKQLSDRDKKVAELEQYIDNLLVRVMEDSPNILMSLKCLKKAVWVETPADIIFRITKPCIVILKFCFSENVA